jgi:hypothetical protein
LGASIPRRTTLPFTSTSAGRTKQELIATKLKIAKSNDRHSSERRFLAQVRREFGRRTAWLAACSSDIRLRVDLN